MITTERRCLDRARAPAINRPECLYQPHRREWRRSGQHCKLTRRFGWQRRPPEPGKVNGSNLAAYAEQMPDLTDAAVWPPFHPEPRYAVLACHALRLHCMQCPASAACKASCVNLIGTLSICSNIGGGGSGNPLSAITSSGGLSSITSAIGGAGAPFGLPMRFEDGFATLKERCGGALDYSADLHIEEAC